MKDKYSRTRDFSGGPVVESLPGNARHTGSISTLEDSTCWGAAMPVTTTEPTL